MYTQTKLIWPSTKSFCRNNRAGLEKRKMDVPRSAFFIHLSSINPAKLHVLMQKQKDMQSFLSCYRTKYISITKTDPTSFWLHTYSEDIYIYMLFIQMTHCNHTCTCILTKCEKVCEKTQQVLCDTTYVTVSCFSPCFTEMKLMEYAHMCRPNTKCIVTCML